MLWSFTVKVWVDRVHSLPPWCGTLETAGNCLCHSEGMMPTCSLFSMGDVPGDVCNSGNYLECDCKRNTEDILWFHD